MRNPTAVVVGPGLYLNIEVTDDLDLEILRMFAALAEKRCWERVVPNAG